MMSFSKKSLSRRHVLRGVGACLSLPLLDAMTPHAYATPSTYKPLGKSEGVHPRMICCYIPNGTNVFEWDPKDHGKDYTLSKSLESLKDHRDDFSVITGIGHLAAKGGHSGADTWLTGADLTGVPGSDYTNTVSADQIAAKKHEVETRFSSLQLSDQSGTGSALHSHTLSFDASGTPIPAENSPKRLFERLFVPESSSDRAAMLQRYAEKKSILDSVLDEAGRLNRRLGKADRVKMDQYLNSVRESEKQIERMEQWIDVKKPEVEEKGLQLGMQSRNGHDRMMWVDVMMELSYLAFATDTTRVISFEWSREAGGFGGSGERHHEFSHHGGDAAMLKKLGEIDRFHLTRLARFMEFLKSTEEEGGNMLESTMILFGSGMNSGKGGAHSPKNLPTLIAGGQNLGLKQGQHLAFDENDHPPLSNLLLTMIQKMGVETDTFRDATGSLEGLV